jgi:hypothetical protein
LVLAVRDQHQVGINLELAEDLLLLGQLLAPAAVMVARAPEQPDQAVLVVAVAGVQDLLFQLI